MCPQHYCVSCKVNNCIHVKRLSRARENDLKIPNKTLLQINTSTSIYLIMH